MNYYKTNGLFPILKKYNLNEYYFSPIKEYSINLFGEFLNQKDLTGENGILEIIEGIKNVSITKDEHDNLEKWEKEYYWENMDDRETDDYIPRNWLRDSPQNFTKDEISQTYYNWSGGEIGYSHSYSDITVCFDNFSDREEYYKTSEVLEVLEKWKEALEKWNNPEEKKKMIEEYEKKKEKED